jgi:hypothetical protein
MFGGTTFHFVTDGLQAALERAVEAAKGRDVPLGGGVATMLQYLSAGLIDETHLAVSPVLIGSGERLFQGMDAPGLGYQVIDHVPGPGAMHMVIAQRKWATQQRNACQFAACIRIRYSSFSPSHESKACRSGVRVVGDSCLLKTRLGPPDSVR